MKYCPKCGSELDNIGGKDVCPPCIARKIKEEANKAKELKIEKKPVKDMKQTAKTKKVK